MTQTATRRAFLRDLGISSAALSFLLNLPSLGFANQQKRKQRLVFMFSPTAFSRKTSGQTLNQDACFPRRLTPLEPFREKPLVLKGVCDKVRGDGDSHMRHGLSVDRSRALPGNVQGGSNTPAGWASGLSIDQRSRRRLQSCRSRTRFGSLEFGVMVPDHADTWTVWSTRVPISRWRADQQSVSDA